jgi:DNA mismatch endonuclease (patch repair protein)
LSPCLIVSTSCRIPATRRAYWLAKIHRNAARDKKNRRALRRIGWRVLTVWECQTRQGGLLKLQSRLWRFLNADRRGS